MASVRQFFCDSQEFKFQIEYRRRELELDERKSFFAALKIQRAFKGYLVRKHVQEMHRAATVLQKYIKGWLVRWHMDELLAEYIEWRNVHYYYCMATKIQALWRGYWIRKLWPIKEIIAQNKRVKEASERIANELQRLFDTLHLRQMEALDEEAKKWVEYILYKLHHLLRTKAREGIYSIHNSNEFSLVEKWLKGFYTYTEHSKILYKCRHIDNFTEEIAPQFNSKQLHKYEAAMRMQYEENKLQCEKLNREPNFTQSQPFNLSDKLSPYEYIRPFNSFELYPSPDPDLTIQRQPDKAKQIIPDDFDIHTLIKEHPDPDSFLIGYVKKCWIHNIPD